MGLEPTRLEDFCKVLQPRGSKKLITDFKRFEIRNQLNNPVHKPHKPAILGRGVGKNYFSKPSALTISVPFHTTIRTVLIAQFTF